MIDLEILTEFDLLEYGEEFNANRSLRAQYLFHQKKLSTTFIKAQFFIPPTKNITCIYMKNTKRK